MSKKPIFSWKQKKKLKLNIWDMLILDTESHLGSVFVQDFMSEDMIFCGVFDGHGPHGHLVARKVRDALPVKLLSFLHSSESKRNGSGKTCFKGNVKPDSAEFEKDCSTEDKMNSVWREAFMKAYKAMDKELRSHPNLDCFCSGSTAVTIVKQVVEEHHLVL